MRYRTLGGLALSGCLLLGLLYALPLLLVPARAQTTTITGTGTTTYTGTSTTTLQSLEWLMLLGDSKTAASTWPITLYGALGRTAPLRSWTYVDGGVAGTTVASTAAAIVATLAPMPSQSAAVAVKVAINFGANDVGSLPAEAVWEANYQIIIDAARVKWPSARIYLSRPWRQGYDAACDTVATRLAHLAAAHPTYVFVADDERVWLKGSDDGATMTTDGIHYSAAGLLEKSAQMVPVLWP